MQLQCTHCSQFLQFSTEAPRFCYACGAPLAPAILERTVAYEEHHYDPAATRFAPAGFGLAATTAPECVGGYRLLRALGSGGMGTVYEAEETTTRRRVALKLLRREFATSDDALERFRREGRLAGTIVHPRCVFVLAADEEAGQPYIVMELMPGETLADLVARRGPLPPREAVPLILDVIEGLQEAHRCGLIHRDVKPSNCFLDAEGRVKIGDFGLAKSLVNQGGLTRSGSFLGTVLFVAPEQIRNDKVDQQADVYSVAATLYFLLTGRAPFETDDPAATLARTMSDPLTPMCQLRPDLPRTLDEVVGRGLARPRDRRWPDLEALRLALLPFVPGPHAVGEIGWRFAAYLVDSFLLICVEFVLLLGLRLVSREGPSATGFTLAEPGLNLAVFLVWFALPEKLWGWSPGKYLFGLRVRGVSTDDRPTWAAAIWRTLFFWVLKDGPFRLLNVLLLPILLAHVSLAVTVFLIIVPELARVAGVGLIASTMRRRNGFRGLHEFLSGTKVIHLPSKQTERFLRGPATEPASAPAAKDLPERLGAFTILSALRSGPEEQVLLGVDEVLDRQVWLWVRPVDGSVFDGRRREVNRTTRPRWLADGREGDRAWDAFVASPGWLLGDLTRSRGRLFWPQARPVLEQLAEELSRSCAEGTLPPSLGPGQIWVQANGRVQLLDTPLRGPADDVRCADPEHCCLALLLQAAALLLEGKPRPPGAPPRPIRAPVPQYASELLARLACVARPFRRVRDFQAALQTVGDRPPTVSRARRSVALVGQAAVLAIGVGFMLALSFIMIHLTFATTYLFPAALGQVALDDLDKDVRRNDALLAVAPPAIASQWQDDARAQARLRDDLDFVQRRREAILASSSWFVREAVEGLEERLRDALAMQVHAIKGPQRIDANLPEITPSARRNAATVHQEVLDKRRDLTENGLRDAVQGIALLLVWPVLWVFWAGLTRGGGLSLALTGIAVVQGDGRRAARWRCVARAALIWIPFVGLLLMSLLLDLWRLAAAGPAVELQLAAWLAWLTWWLAVAWLPLHLVSVLRWPDRSWHDRLAGTFLVPR